MAALSGYITQVNDPCFGLSIGSASVWVTGGTVPYTYLWDNGTITYDSQTITNLPAGTWDIQVTDSDANKIEFTVVITEPAYAAPYKFGSECDLRCFLIKANCCFVDKAYDTVVQRRSGLPDDACVTDLILLNNFLETIGCWYPEGTIINAGKSAYFVVLITAYPNLGTISITYPTDNDILTYVFDSLLTLAQNMDAIVTDIISNGFTASYNIYLSPTHGTNVAQLTIYAPIGSGWNGMPVDVKTALGAAFSIITTNGFPCGVDAKTALAPCLSEDQIGDMIAKAKDMANCDCAAITSDDTNPSPYALN